MKHGGTGTLTISRVEAALATHDDVMRIYEQGYNAHTFDFEDDLGRFVAPEITTVSGSGLSGRSLLAEASNARADYVRSSGATVSIDCKTMCVAELDAAVVLVAEGDFTFTYPDRTTSTLRVLASSTLRLLDGIWVFQHIHFGAECAW